MLYCFFLYSFFFLFYLGSEEMDNFTDRIRICPFPSYSETCVLFIFPLVRKLLTSVLTNLEIVLMKKV